MTHPSWQFQHLLGRINEISISGMPILPGVSCKFHIIGFQIRNFAHVTTIS